MRKMFILDGYNVIYRIPELTAKLKESLEEARRALAVRMADWKRSRVNADVIIVFDGRDSVFPDSSRMNVCGIKCVYTATKETADDRIISMVRLSEEPSRITVISDDNQIRNSSRAHGARIEYSAFFETAGRKKSKTAERPDKAFDARKNRSVTDYYEGYLRSKGKISEE